MDPHLPGLTDLARRRRAAGRRARRLGRRGERVAARVLRRRGYRILARNVRTPAGEVDLLAEEGGQTVLVEVKSGRLASDPGGGGAAIASRFGYPQRRRQKAVVRWLRRQIHFRNTSFRHDLVVVTFDGWRSVVTIRRNVLDS